MKKIEYHVGCGRNIKKEEINTVLENMQELIDESKQQETKSIEKQLKACLTEQ